MTRRLSPFLALMLAVGYVFLYGPIVSLVVYSFNASRLVTVWAGFSTHWYVELMHNEAIQRAALVSLQIAVSAASGALVLGTLAGYALQRYRRFRGRALFGEAMDEFAASLGPASRQTLEVDDGPKGDGNQPARHVAGKPRIPPGQHLEPIEGSGGAVRMHRAHAPGMPGIHRLEHVEGLAAADFADDNPVRILA
jgi:hypothetical protein